MDWQEIGSEFGKSLIVITGAMLLLRLAGRKSISQTTIQTTVILISIGTVIVQPIAQDSIVLALVAAVTFIALLITVEKLQIHWKWLERLMVGQPVTVVRDGKLLPEELKKLRLPEAQLRMRLRENGITDFSEVRSVTVETNGQIGFEWADDAKPVTMGELRSLLRAMQPGSGDITGSQPESGND